MIAWLSDLKSHGWTKLVTGKFFLLLVLSLITLSVTFRLLRPGFYTMYDDMQVARVWQMDKCIGDGQIPCRWVPDLGLGYGYPLYIYYSPLPYYFMEVVHFVGFSFISTVKLGFVFSVFFSAVFFYLFVRNFGSKAASLLATVFYIVVPFRAASIYVRGAMGEAWGLAAVPLLFWGFEYYLKKRNSKSAVIFSLGVAAFLVTHNLTVLLFLPVFAGWFLLRIWQVKPEKKFVGKLLLFGFLGFMLSAFYTLPLFFERNLVHLETITSAYFGYLQHFLSLKQIFITSRWGYGPSIYGPNDIAFLGVGPLHSLVALIGVLLCLKLPSHKRLIPLFFGGVFLTYAFLAHEKSTVVWQALTMDIFQFPWRMISVCIFAASFLALYLYDQLTTKYKTIVALASIIAVFSFSANFFQPKDWFALTDSEKLSGKSLKRQLTASIYDYLPIGARRAPDDIASENLLLIDGVIEPKTAYKGTNWFDYEIKVTTKTAKVALPAYDFPKWEIMVNNAKIDHEQYGDFGLPSFSLSQGDVEISAKLKNSSVRKIGDLLTLFGLAATVIIYLYANTYKKTNTV